MSVELDAKNPECFGMGVANGTWFHLLKHTRIGDVLGRVYTNDPLDVTAEQALECAKIMREFHPPPGWGLIGEDGEERMKAMFVEFFEQCQGFTTH